MGLPSPSLWHRVLEQLRSYARPVDARTVAAGMVGIRNWQQVAAMFQSLELDGMARCCDTKYKNYVITEEGRRYLDAEDNSGA